MCMCIYIYIEREMYICIGQPGRPGAPGRCRPGGNPEAGPGPGFI